MPLVSIFFAAAAIVHARYRGAPSRRLLAGCCWSSRRSGCERAADAGKPPRCSGARMNRRRVFSRLRAVLFDLTERDARLPFEC